jgi:hypothetical protein
MLPVDPRHRVKSHRSVATATARRIVLNFAQKSLGALIGDLSKSGDYIRRAIRQIDSAPAAGAHAKHERCDKPKSPHRASRFFLENQCSTTSDNQVFHR